MEDYRAYLKSMIDETPGLSLRKLAREMEISPAMLSKFLNGTKSLSIGNIARLIHVTGLEKRSRTILLNEVILEKVPRGELRDLIQTILERPCDRLPPPHDCEDVIDS